VQSLEPAVLAWMHRVHTAAEAGLAVQAVREGGITNLSLDLIYALPASVPRDWDRDLDAALRLDPDHLSCYGLTIEPRTPLGRRERRGEVAAAGEDAWERDFLLTHRRLRGAGFEHYEVSNYARPGRRSRHNASYWTGAPYLGLGPSSHGFDGDTRRWNLRDFAAWEAAVSAGVDPVEGCETLSPEQASLEGVYLGLRSDAGLELSHSDVGFVRRWEDQGWAVLMDQRLRLTAMGWLRLDALAAALTEHRSRY
jgi:oxygen-independent coproporphyrinogen-3 oxidase